MDSFQVKAKETQSLDRSHLCDEMQAEIEQSGEMFPVLIGEQIGYFHDVDGGYVRSVSDSRQDGYHIVNLIHEVQGPDSPPNKLYSDQMEAHLDTNYYQMDVEDVWQMTQAPSGLHSGDDYPQGDFVLSLKVSDYRIGPYSFSEALSANIDKREQEFSHNNE